MTQNHTDELGLYAARLFNDPVFFARELFAAMGWDKYAPIGWVEEDMIRFAAEGPQFSGVLGWRGLGKTHVITITIACWDLFRDPESKILIVSKSGAQAKKAKKGIRDCIFKVPFLQHLAPRQPDGGLFWRDNDEQLDVGPSQPSMNPSVSCLGIDGQLPGTRASRVIADDVETPDNTVTLDARKNLEAKVSEFKAISIYGHARITYVGTYHHEQSLYLAVAQKGYDFRSYPVLFPHPEDKVQGLAPVYRDRLDRGQAKPGDIAAAYRISNDFVINAKAEGRTFFAMQYMLIANLGDENRYPLKLSDLIIFSPLPDKAPLSIVWGRSNGQGKSTAREDIPSHGFGSDALYGPIMFDPTMIPFQATKMWVDPSGKGRDNTGFAVVSFANAMLYERTVGSDERGHSLEVMHRLAATAQRFRVNDIGIEDFGLQTMFGQLMEPILREYFIEPGDPNHPQLQNGWRCSLSMVKPKNAGYMKEVRIIQALEPVMSTHRLVMSEESIRSERLQRQITRICKQRNCLKHEDEIESLANAVQLFEDRLNTTQAQGIKRKQDEAFMKMLNDYGDVQQEARWFNHYQP